MSENTLNYRIKDLIKYVKYFSFWKAKEVLIECKEICDKQKQELISGFIEDIGYFTDTCIDQSHHEPREDDKENVTFATFDKRTHFLVKREDLVKWFKRIEHFLKVLTEGENPLVLAYPRWKFDLVKDEKVYGIK